VRVLKARLPDVPIASIQRIVRELPDVQQRTRQPGREAPVRMNRRFALLNTCYADLMFLSETIAPSQRNNRYNALLTMVDASSRFLAAMPIRSKAAVEVADALQTLFYRYYAGCRQLRVDQGSEFINQNVKAVCAQFGCQLYITRAFDSRSTGAIESEHRLVRTEMEPVLSRTGGVWINRLSGIMFRINTRPRRVLEGFSSWQAFFGSNPLDRITSPTKPPVARQPGVELDGESVPEVELREEGLATPEQVAALAKTRGSNRSLREETILRASEHSASEAERKGINVSNNLPTIRPGDTVRIDLLLDESTRAQRKAPFQHGVRALWSRGVYTAREKFMQGQTEMWSVNKNGSVLRRSNGSVAMIPRLHMLKVSQPLPIRPALVPGTAAPREVAARATAREVGGDSADAALRRIRSEAPGQTLAQARPRRNIEPPRRVM